MSELDELAEQAEAIDVQAAAPNGADAEHQDQAPQAPGNYEAIAFILASFREVASRLLRAESLRRTLADPECETCARVLAPVADKYGVQLGGWLGGPEAMALITAGPILWRAYSELDLELRARRAKQPSGAPPAAEPLPEIEPA